MQPRYLTLSVIFRLILSLLLVAGVYSETGVYTTLAIFLTMTNAEMVTYIMWRKGAAERALKSTLASFDDV